MIHEFLIRRVDLATIAQMSSTFQTFVINLLHYNSEYTGENNKLQVDWFKSDTRSKTDNPVLVSLPIASLG